MVRRVSYGHFGKSPVHERLHLTRIFHLFRCHLFCNLVTLRTFHAGSSLCRTVLGRGGYNACHGIFRINAKDGEGRTEFGCVEERSEIGLIHGLTPQAKGRGAFCISDLLEIVVSPDAKSPDGALIQLGWTRARLKSIGTALAAAITSQRVAWPASGSPQDHLVTQGRGF
jgi:hypothetical protein